MPGDTRGRLTLGEVWRLADPGNLPSEDDNEPRARLRAALSRFGRGGFAVLDGGLFEDLPARLKHERLFARSLFLDTADPEIQAAGPWLLKLDQSSNAADQVFAAVGDKPAAVYWCCTAGEQVLWRHLRTLNMALIPRWAADGGAEPPADGSGQDPTPVTFRHWDPRVLGALMPALDIARFARILGSADEVAFFATDHGGFKRLLADTSRPPAPTGTLVITSRQTEALNQRRISASHRRIAAYLRTVAPAETRGASVEALQAHVLASEKSGRALGIETEAGHARWAFVMAQTQGRILHMPEALAAIRHPGSSADENLKRFMKGAIAELQHRSVGGVEA